MFKLNFMIVTPQKFRKKIQAAEVLCLYSFVHIAKPAWNWSWYFSRLVQLGVSFYPMNSASGVGSLFLLGTQRGPCCHANEPWQVGSSNYLPSSSWHHSKIRPVEGHIWRSFSSQTDGLPHRWDEGSFFFAFFFWLFFFYIYIYSCYIYICVFYFWCQYPLVCASYDLCL